jgi:exosortase
VALLAVNATTLGALVHLSRADETASHLVLIPFVSLALIYVERDSIFAEAQSAWGLGLALVATGLGLSVWAGFAQHDGLSVAVAGLVLSWVGGFLAIYGGKPARSALFPLLFLAFMIPMPGGLLAALTLFLKSSSADVVAVLFTLTGTPHHREGFVFHLPTFVIEVADECSGIRSSIALMLTGLLAGHLYLNSWSRKAILAAAIIPAAILKNGIRIVTLSLLAEHVDPGYLTGELHHEGGIVFFLFTLALLAPLFLLLQRSDTRRRSGASLA